MKKNKFGSTLLKQILAAKEFLGFKSSKSFRREKSTKISYVPGSLGISRVSAAIQKDYGVILSRRKRKIFAKVSGEPFKVYYNG